MSYERFLIGVGNYDPEFYFIYGVGDKVIREIPRTKTRYRQFQETYFTEKIARVRIWYHK